MAETVIEFARRQQYQPKSSLGNPCGRAGLKSCPWFGDRPDLFGAAGRSMSMWSATKRASSPAAASWPGSGTQPLIGYLYSILDLSLHAPC